MGETTILSESASIHKSPSVEPLEVANHLVRKHFGIFLGILNLKHY